MNRDSSSPRFDRKSSASYLVGGGFRRPTSGERGAPSQQDSVEKKEPHAVVGGINLHAAVAFDARDKPRMERMCRYLARPPIAQHRLTRRADGSLRYEMKRVWRDGTSAIVLQPLDLIAALGGGARRRRANGPLR